MGSALRGMRLFMALSPALLQAQSPAAPMPALIPDPGHPAPASKPRRSAALARQNAARRMQFQDLDRRVSSQIVQLEQAKEALDGGENLARFGGPSLSALALDAKSLRGELSGGATGVDLADVSKRLDELERQANRSLRLADGVYRFSYGIESGYAWLANHLVAKDSWILPSTGARRSELRHLLKQAQAQYAQGDPGFLDSLQKAENLMKDFDDEFAQARSSIATGGGLGDEFRETAYENPGWVLAGLLLGGFGVAAGGIALARGLGRSSSGGSSGSVEGIAIDPVSGHLVMPIGSGIAIDPVTGQTEFGGNGTYVSGEEVAEVAREVAEIAGPVAETIDSIATDVAGQIGDILNGGN